MFLLCYLRFVILLTLLIPIPNTTGQGQSIGRLPNCGHALSGEVFVKNDREILIKGFHYDGSGPAAWFHAMRKGIVGGIHTTLTSYYYTLPFPGDKCDRVKGKRYSGEDITLILPVSVKELETIGMLCYQYCHNFGHVTIPPNLNVPAAPDNLPVTPKCPPPNYLFCMARGGKGGNRETINGGPNCGSVGPGPAPPPGPPTTTRKTTTTTTTTTRRPTTTSTTLRPGIVKPTTTRHPVKPRPMPTGEPVPQPGPPPNSTEKPGMHPRTALIIVIIVFVVAVVVIGVIGFKVWTQNREVVPDENPDAL